MIPSFNLNVLKGISETIADIFTHKQLSEQFKIVNIQAVSEGTNKADQVYFTLKNQQKLDNCGNNILSLILSIINLNRYSDEEAYEKNRQSFNERLIYEGIQIDKEGRPKLVDKAKTVSEAKARSQKIKDRVHGIGVHFEILPYCEAEWLKENYFHAILEITKSVAEKLRLKSGYTSDGSVLVDQCFGLGGDNRPMLAFNTLQNDSDRREHSGLRSFIKGFFSMYRNPKAHDPKLLEDTQLTEMTEVLVIATIIYNKLDKTYKTGYK